MPRWGTAVADLGGYPHGGTVPPRRQRLCGDRFPGKGYHEDIGNRYVGQEPGSGEYHVHPFGCFRSENHGGILQQAKGRESRGAPPGPDPLGGSLWGPRGQIWNPMAVPMQEQVNREKLRYRKQKIQDRGRILQGGSTSGQGTDGTYPGGTCKSGPIGRRSDLVQYAGPEIQGR